MATEKPVIVLVHGAWHYPLYYRSLIDPLRAQGYTVLAPTNATVGIDDSIAGKTHKDDMKRIHEVLIPHLDAGREAVLVCHSYGGIPGTASLEGQTVEERAGRGLKGGVKSVLYIAAMALPQRGLSLYMILNSQWPDWHKEESGMRVLLPQAGDAFYNDLPAELKERAMSGLMHQSQESFMVASDYVATDVKIPKVYVVCTEDQAIPPEGQQAMAAACQARVVELKTGHSPWMKEKEAQELLGLIKDLARS